MKTNASAIIIPPTNTPASSAEADIRGIRGPVEVPSGWTWVWWALALAAAAALALWAWKRWKKKKETPVELPPPAPPHERAFAKLREALSLIQQPQPFCVLVSDTIRVYLEERFNLRAPERTTEEFLDELQSSALLVLEQKRALGEFLSGCDLVKFARYEPTEAELRKIYDAGVRLVEETQPPPPPPLGSQPGPAAEGQPQ